MQKNYGHISGFTFVRKAEKYMKENILKKILPAYFCRQDLQKAGRNFFKNKWILKYFNILTNKYINVS